MKKILTLVLTLFFAIEFLPGRPVIAQTDQKESSSDFADENLQDQDLPGGKDLPDLSSIIDDLSFLKDDLYSELEDTPNMALRVVANKVNRCANFLENALESSDDDLDLCDENLTRAIDLLDKAATQFDDRKCQSGNINKRCIPSDIVDLYLSDLEDIISQLDEAMSVDDDEDDIPDICGFAE